MKKLFTSRLAKRVAAATLAVVLLASTLMSDAMALTVQAANGDLKINNTTGSVTMAVGETGNLVYEGSFNDFRGYSYVQMYTSDSSVVSLARTDKTTTTVTANATGTARVGIMEYKMGLFGWQGEWLKYVDVTVVNPSVPATSVAVTPETLTTRVGDAATTLTAVVEPSNTTDTLSWTSSDSNIASVLNGVVTPVSAGSATITAMAGGQSDTCVVTVLPQSANVVISYTVNGEPTDLTQTVSKIIGTSIT